MRIIKEDEIFFIKKWGMYVREYDIADNDYPRVYFFSEHDANKYIISKMKTVMIYRNDSTFVDLDVEFLGCDRYQFTPTLKGYLKMFWYFLTHRYDRYIIYFCNVMALIPIFFSRVYFGKSFIFAGGYDACYIPELNYGVFDGSFRSKLIKLAYRTVHKVVISSGYELAERLKEHVDVDPEVIYCGVPTDYWKPDLTIERDIDYITVGYFKDMNTWIRKGGDVFFNIARIKPDKKFAIVNFHLDINVPENVMVIKFISNTQLKELYNRSVHYCQFSRYESFGFALAEAMSMGCIPIVADVGIMYYIAGSTGNSLDARQRIIDLFSYNIRKEKLLTLLK
jgi:glycosyltransferase involved in cell wall biosynthesis